MEQDLKTLLAAQLDQSLLEHTRRLGSKEGGPDIVDAYKLQGLAERHYYLTAVHQFTAAEVEALLWFKDPLAVADACWEENSHEHRFPICEIMEEIGAYEKFPMKVPLSQRVEELKEILEHNYAAYTASWADMSREELIKNSQEIAAVRSAYSFMMDDFPFDPAEVNNLLKLKDPLFFLADRWLLPMEDPSFVHDILEVLSDPQCLKKYIANTPPQAKKPSVRKQLRNAVQTASQRPPAGHKHPGEDAR